MTFSRIAIRRISLQEENEKSIAIGKSTGSVIQATAPPNDGVSAFVARMVAG
jgi:hypothetical protein